ncbi:MAG: porin [Proteobacteria bacterium]|nr:porin [Pseudomonadota bacterium]
MAFSAEEDMPSVEEMWKIIQQQQKQILELQQNAQITEVKIEATADAVEQVASADVSVLSRWAEKTSMGGYGELHYNNLENQLDGGKADKEEIDLHRFVFYFGHQFDDDLRFYSEFEVEHAIAGDGKVGEVEIEQAFIEWDYADKHRAKGGVFLVPVGIINETHEPDTFYGVERNLVEKNIIPATWWEGGVGLTGEISPGLSYDLAATSGLFLDDGEYKIRDGRQKTGKAKADDFAYTSRIKYTGLAGLELAATLQYQSNLLQSEIQSSGAADVDALLFEAHADYRTGPFALRALYATWDIDEALDLTKTGASEQTGWYVEPSYRLTDNLGVFARYSQWDNQAADSSDTEYSQTDVGLNYWLHDNVVLKFDYQDQDAPSGKDEFDGFNLGIGWSY